MIKMQIERKKKRKFLGHSKRNITSNSNQITHLIMYTRIVLDCLICKNAKKYIFSTNLEDDPVCELNVSCMFIVAVVK